MKLYWTSWELSVCLSVCLRRVKAALFSSAQCQAWNFSGCSFCLPQLAILHPILSFVCVCVCVCGVSIKCYNYDGTSLLLFAPYRADRFLSRLCQSGLHWNESPAQAQALTVVCGMWLMRDFSSFMLQHMWSILFDWLSKSFSVLYWFQHVKDPENLKAKRPGQRELLSPTENTETSHQ